MSDVSSEPQKLEKNHKNLIFKRRSNKPEAKRNFGGPLRVIVTTLAIFIASQFVAALLVSLVLNVTNPGMNIGDLDESTPVQFGYVLLAEALVVLMVIQILKNRGLALANIGLGRRPALSDITRSLAGFGVFYVLLIAAGLALTIVAPGFKTDQPQDIGFENLKNSYDQILAFVALVFFPPIAEEILTRGYLFSGLRSKLKFAPAMMLTSLIFAAAHLPGSSGLVWGAAINTFILSIVLVYLREKTGALYAGMAVHALNNLVAFIVLML